MPNKLVPLVLLPFIFLVTSCSVSIQTALPTAATPSILTATMPPSPTARASETPLPPPPTSTVAPVPGVTSTQINVRAEPSTAGMVLGVIAANSNVQIVGRDAGGNWWQIIYEAGADGRGWVTAQYVNTAGTAEVPVIGGDSKDGNSAIVVQQLNVRSGPGTSFNALGILNANDVVSLTGRNRDNSWLQIAFPNGSDSKGWVNAAFVQAQSVDGLPILTDSGEVVETGTPMDTPSPPTPTLVPASMDIDSADSPLKTVFFERTGTQILIFSGDVSAPEGDTEDWIAFTPYETLVYASIQCNGNGSLSVEITGSRTVACNEGMTALSVQAGVRTLVHIQAVVPDGGLGYVNYTLMIKTIP